MIILFVYLFIFIHVNGHEKQVIVGIGWKNG